MKNPNGVPTPAEFGLLRAFLAKNKFSQPEINAAIGTSVNGRTRAQITDQLRDYLKNSLSILSVPRVRLGDVVMPLSSAWTYKNIIEPVVKLVRGKKK